MTVACLFSEHQGSMVFYWTMAGSISWCLH